MQLRPLDQTLWPRLLVTLAFIISLACSLTTAFPIWDGLLDLDRETSLANAYSVVLWLIAAILAGTLAKHGDKRLGWSSVCVLAALVAVSEATDIKDALRTMFFPTAHHSAWTIVAAPVLLAPLIVASRTLLATVTSLTHFSLLSAFLVFSLAPLILDDFEQPTRVGEEGS